MEVDEPITRIVMADVAAVVAVERASDPEEELLHAMRRVYPL